MIKIKYNPPSINLNASNPVQTYAALPNYTYSSVPFTIVNNYPLWDIHEFEDKFVVKMEVPGYADMELEVHVESRTLTVKGNSALRTKYANLVSERKSLDSFTKNYLFVKDLEVHEDGVSADLKFGVLTINLPKVKRVVSKKVHISSK